MYPSNTAKVRIIHELERLFAAEPGKTFHILDVGVTGPAPLNFWEPLFKYPNFQLTGVDIDAASIEALKKRPLSPQIKLLETLSGYDVEKRFGKNIFDIVVSTQVLEHVRYPAKAIGAAAAVLKPGGLFYLCFDNSDYPRKDDHLRELLKDIVVRLTGSERYHDKDLPASEVRKMLTGAGFDTSEPRFYGIHPLKDIHGHESSVEKKDEVMEAWMRLEEILNDDGHAAAHPARYLVVYFKAIKK